MFGVEKLLNSIAPFSCLICKQEGDLLCAWCKPDACPKIPSRCYRCQKQTQDAAVCIVCQRHTVLKRVWVHSEYTATAKLLVTSLKYEYKRPAAAIIASYVDEIMPYMSPEPVVIHIPTASKRVRMRGFNHAHLIAWEFALQRFWPLVSMLQRVGQTQQVGAKRTHRLQQLETAFWVQNPQAIQGKQVLLIDDVLTTGATIETAARVLKKAGAKTVNAAIFAQAI